MTVSDYEAISDILSLPRKMYLYLYLCIVMSGEADALNAHIISPVLVEIVLEGVGSSLVSSTQQASTSTSTSCTSTSTSTSTEL